MALPQCFVLITLLAGCLPCSDNPLPSQGDISQIAQPFLGDWVLTEMLGGQDVASMTQEVALEGTDIVKATISDGTQFDTLYYTMHQYNGTVYVCEKRDSDVGTTYSIYKLVLSGDNDETLRVFPLNSTNLEDAIDGGVITGIVQDVEGSKAIRITDTSENLASYVSSATDVFDASPVVVFQKLAQ